MQQRSRNFENRQLWDWSTYAAARSTGRPPMMYHTWFLTASEICSIKLWFQCRCRAILKQKIQSRPWLEPILVRKFLEKKKLLRLRLAADGCLGLRVLRKEHIVSFQKRRRAGLAEVNVDEVGYKHSKADGFGMRGLHS